jgi:hypothetical protein
MSVRGKKMAEIFLGTNDRNNPGDVKGQMSAVTLFYIKNLRRHT